MKSRLRLYDSHLHLQDPRLDGIREGPGHGNDPSETDPPSEIVAQLANGTHPDDWPLLAALKGDRIFRAYGVHPWRVDALPKNWDTALREYLSSGAASVGEIGLDRWVEPRNEDLQMKVFVQQLQIASELRLAPSIHCVRAWGMLVDCLKKADLPKGFLVHGFAGSKEVLYQLLDLGGYVSFSAYGADPGRQRIRDAARACPMDRLLAETDAPGMVPPENVCRYRLSDAAGRMHHPWEIETAYDCLAEWKKMPVEELATKVEANFKRLFCRR